MLFSKNDNLVIDYIFKLEKILHFLFILEIEKIPECEVT